MIRKQIYIAQVHEAKLKRLAQTAGRSEAEIIRAAIEAIPEQTDPLRQMLIAQGLIMPQPSTTTRADAERAYQAYLQQIGDRHFGLTQAVLEDRVR